MPKTPTTPGGLSQFDHLPADDAVHLAWTNGGIEAGYHYLMQQEVMDRMPLLARALDRMAKDRISGKY